MYASYTHTCTTQFARYNAHPVSYSVPCTISTELRQYCRFTLKPHPNESHAWFEGWMRLVIYGAILVHSLSFDLRSLYCILLNLVYLICSAKRTQSGYGLLRTGSMYSVLRTSTSNPRNNYICVEVPSFLSVLEDQFYPSGLFFHLSRTIPS